MPSRPHRLPQPPCRAAHTSHVFLPRSLEISSLSKTIRITAKSTKRIREALQPVLGKYGVNVELALLRRVRAATALGWGVRGGSAIRAELGSTGWARSVPGRPQIGGAVADEL